MCVCVGQPLIPGIFLSIFPPYFFETVFSLNLNFTGSARIAGQEILEVLLLSLHLPPAWELKMHGDAPGFHVDSGNRTWAQQALY